MEKELKPHEQRLVDEAAELSTKINKLSDFVDSPVYDDLHAVDRNLLILQLGTMRSYSDILDMRIQRFTE